jgi:hypothetical protein
VLLEAPVGHRPIDRVRSRAVTAATRGTHLAAVPQIHENDTSDMPSDLGDETIVRSKKFLSALSDEGRERTVALGLILASLPLLPFADVAALLDAKPEVVTKWIHGEAPIPAARLARLNTVSEIVRNVMGVIKETAFQRWLNIEMPELGGISPIQAIHKGRIDAVRDLSRRYRNESFA